MNVPSLSVELVISMKEKREIRLALSVKLDISASKVSLFVLKKKKNAFTSISPVNSNLSLTSDTTCRYS